MNTQPEDTVTRGGSQPRSLWQVEQELRDYKRTLSSTKKKFDRPSYEKELRSYINFIDVISRDNSLKKHPLTAIPCKLRMYEFAASHGVEVPAVFRTWATPGEMEFEDLPDEFVVKADGGASSEGVVPLRRSGEGRFERADGLATYSSGELKDVFRRLQAAGSIAQPIFAEELLKQDRVDGIPNDVKIFTAYGEILMVMIRGVVEHGSPHGITKRYVDAQGADMNDLIENLDNDMSLEVPPRLPDLVATAKHLSRAIGVPFCRVDLYGVQDRIVFGEITRAPGDYVTYMADHDERMGRQWLAGRARLDIDCTAGRPPGILWGPESSLDLYPPEGVRPASVSRTSVSSCADWCRESPTPVPAGS
ncbi:hypothetical protein M3G48_07020 [Kocuria rhizophila]|uniref:ATP-grasp fold amidoligase family protein n=1 Tax=Kocuria rhizophila TaxID=72000 RepID=UPI0009E1C549|nr:ATP-grasp fold amidoligase family protein [Kocuria rhizophila]MCT1457052.1 hypothetical protein [Kocuria rhizophila]MCT1880398.1 hypothetical protein [Kocuria rhizophila]